MLVVLFVAAVFLGRAAFVMFTKQRAAAQLAQEAAADMTDLRTRQEYLTGEIARLETERGAEEEIRKKFRVVKEGEHLLVLIDPQKGETREEDDENRSFFEKIFGFFEIFKRE